jgi:putative endonuclease
MRARFFSRGKPMSRRKGEDRRRSLANLAGADAERLALLLLVLKGYWPLARRYLAPSGEIDLIMRRGRTIVAVEVKARRTPAEAAAAITSTKLRNISRAMASFRAHRQLDDSYVFRCDAVLVAPWHWPRHIVNIGALTDRT